VSEISGSLAPVRVELIRPARPGVRILADFRANTAFIAVVGFGSRPVSADFLQVLRASLQPVQ
jgi:hypothetical protein